MRRTRAQRRLPRAAALPLLAAAAACAACGSAATLDGQGQDPPAATTCPIQTEIAAPAFSAHVLPMLRSTCGANSATSCHGSPSPVGHVSYAPSLAAAEVHAQLVGVEPSSAPPDAGWMRIAPGDAARSWLVEKVTSDDPGGVGQAYGNRMPYGLPNLCDPTVQTLVNWIERGAPND
jgi:hypothetical protein